MLIPRIFHRIWIGPNPLPDQFAEYGRTWERHHPDWEMRLWTDAEVAKLDALPEAFRVARNEVEAADVLRLELLRVFGGVHVDTDIECLRPIDPLLGGVRAFAGREHPRQPYIGGALMGAVPGHRVIERALREIGESVGSGTVVEATGPRFLTPILDADPEVVVFDQEVFHPSRFVDGVPRTEFPDSYAIHHFAHTGITLEVARERLERKNARIRDLKAKLAATRARNRRARRQLRRMRASRWWRLRVWVSAAAEPVRRALRGRRPS